MNSYMVITIGIICVMIVVLIVTLMVSIFKGVKAGKTEIEIKIAGIFSMTIHLMDVSKNKDDGSKLNS